MLRNLFIGFCTQSKKTEFHLANRLDRDTSGVILVTKSHNVAAKLVKAFTDHKVRKTYIASCVGQAPKWKKMTIKSGHGRSKFGACRVYAAKDVGRTLPSGSSVRDMETLFEVLSINGDQCNQESSEIDIVVEKKSSVGLVGNKVAVLVRAYPRSGRTHQIQLHYQYLGILVKGDVKYEGVYKWNGRVCDGHQLHAESLSFEHPVTGSTIVINAPLPSWATQG
ncbi:putative 23S rRNA pseudouridine(955/2504/2580) synthase [Helianthus debilis subsp. tardiflorus]